MNTVSIRIEGMHCDHCVQAVTRALTEAGAQDVQVDLAAGTAVAAVPSSLSAEMLAAAVEDIGFDAYVQ